MARFFECLNSVRLVPDNCCSKVPIERQRGARQNRAQKSLSEEEVAVRDCSGSVVEIEIIVKVKAPVPVPSDDGTLAQPNAGPTQSRETVCSGLSRVRQTALGERQLRACFFERLCDAIIRGKSRMSQCSRTDLCGGASSDARPYRDP